MRGKRLSLQRDARAAELGGAGGAGQVTVESIGVEVDAAADAGLELAVGRGHFDAALGIDLRRAGSDLVQLRGGVDVDVGLRIAALFQLGHLGRQRFQLRLQFGDGLVAVVGGGCRETGAAHGNGKCGSQKGITHGDSPEGRWSKSAGFAEACFPFGNH